MGSHRQCSSPICGAWYRLYGVHGNIVGPPLSGVHGGPLGEQIVSSGGVARSDVVGCTLVNCTLVNCDMVFLSAELLW